MKQTDTEKMLQNEPELDALLDQMAEDVPPMPAYFHDNWMSAIRAEAKQDVPVMEEKEEKPHKISDSELFSTIDSMYQKGGKDDN